MDVSLEFYRNNSSDIAHPQVTNTILILLHRAVLERLSSGVLRIPQCAWRFVDETDHRMFPVANVVSNAESATVKGIEVKVKGVDSAVAMVVDDDRATHCTLCFPFAVRQHTEEISRDRIRVWLDLRCEIDVLSAETVEEREVVESHRLVAHDLKVDSRFCVI